VVYLSLPWCDLYVIMSFVSSWIGRCYSSSFMLLRWFYSCNLWRHLVPWCEGDSVHIMCVS
jgi:hypothetical protein